MEIYKDGETFFTVLEKGEEIMKSLMDFVQSERINSGFVSCIGAIKNFEIGAYDLEKKEYVKKRYKNTYELLSLTGNISKKEDGEYIIHLHCIAGDEKLNLVGGHFFEGEVAVTCEIFVFPINKVLLRHLDKDTGLFLIKKGG